MKPQNLGEMVVTATGWETPLEKVGGSSVTVITSEDLEAKQQITIEEVLKGVPGLDIVSNGGPGTQSTVFLRGADSKNTLVLVDGIMWNDTSGPNRGANLADLTVDNIERIEIVRGPMSVLYGSNATAGVINIITKKGAGPPTLYAGVEAGSYESWRWKGGASGGSERYNFSIAVSGNDVGGFSTANDDNGDIPHDGNTSEDDGWENMTVSARFGLDLTPDFDINAVIRYVDSEVDMDEFNFVGGYVGDRFDTDPVTWITAPNPDGPTKAKNKSEYTGTKLNVHNFFMDRRIESEFFLKHSENDRTGIDNDGDLSFDFEGETTELGWQGSLTLFDMNTLTVGVTTLEEKMNSNSSGIENAKATTDSIWLQDQLFLLEDALVITAGLRYDDHDRFGSETTYRFAPSYTIRQTGTTIKGSWGTGFRSPSLFELFSAFGNTDLDPETSEGWDIGVEQELLNETLKFGVTWFALDFEDRIAWDPDRIIPGQFFPGGYDQLEGDTETEGIESFVEWSPLPDLELLLTYTYTDTEDPDGEPLIRRPDNKVFFNTRYRFLDRVLFNLDVYWVDERHAAESSRDKNGNQVDMLDDYYLVNLAVTYDINQYLQVHGRVDNLFDEEYEESWSYATPGLSGYVGFQVRY